MVIGALRVVRSLGLNGADWLAVLRIGLGLWWLESWRHKDKHEWLVTGSGIGWASGVASEHRWAFVRTGFARTVDPHAKLMAYVVLAAEFSIGVGLILGFLTPIALVGGFVLNILYFTLMIHDWAEQGQNSMMALMSVVCFFGQANQIWSIDHALHILGG